MVALNIKLYSFCRLGWGEEKSVDLQYLEQNAH